MPDKIEATGYSPEDEEAINRMSNEGGICVPEETPDGENDDELKKALIREIFKLISGD